MTGFQNRNRLNIRLGNMAKSVRPAVLRSLRRGGLKIENSAVEGIIDPPKTGRIYKSRHRKGAVHQASAPGEFPAADSGRLHQSITTAVVQDDNTRIAVETAANTPYARALEYGSDIMEPRPFMGPSYREHREAIKDEVTLAVAQAIRRNGRGGA